MVEYSVRRFFANYMAHNNMICHPCACRIYVFLVHIPTRTLSHHRFSIKKFIWNCAECAATQWKEKLCSVSRWIFFSSEAVFAQKPCTPSKLHSRHKQCWFNKYASTVGLLLIYDKYTQMLIVILRFAFLLLQTKGHIVASIFQRPNLLINSIKFLAPFRLDRVWVHSSLTRQ